MTDKNRTYVAIDLKSFYSSVECVARGLDPLTTNLVMAYVSRSQRHPRMSMYNRAAQFYPFAALTDYEKAIEEARKKQETEVRRRNAPVENFC